MNYDLAIIGAGWAGFNAAKKAKDAGLKVVLIDKGAIGGTCLNRGCIPTKALIQSAKVYSLIKKSKDFGIGATIPAINFAEIQSRKEKIVFSLRAGIEFLLKGIDFVQGEARLISAGSLQAGEKHISAESILIAAGSKPLEPSFMKFDGKKIVSSDQLLEIKQLPRSLLIIGGGVIGCEFASLFATLGVEVTLVEKMPQLLPGIDKETARKLETVYRKKGIKALTNTDVSAVKLNEFDLVLLCVGRSADTAGLSLENCGVATEKGKILVDDYLRTNISGIYAAGDCTGKLMLAHYAAYQGCIAVENMLNPSALRKADNTNVPSCIFTGPEIAVVGLNEEQAAGAGWEARVNKFDFLGSGMARILDESEGFVKIISDKKTSRVLGASIIGPRATELIAVLTTAVSNGLSTEQLKNTIFAHPTLAESIHDALN